MSCYRKTSSYSNARETRFPLFCLFALLPYLLLPLIYYNHLTGNQDFPLYLMAGPESRAPVIWGHADQPMRPPHESACPICRAASHFQDYGVSAVVLTPDHPCLARLSPFSSYPSHIANLDELVSGPRAPPVSL